MTHQSRMSKRVQAILAFVVAVTLVVTLLPFAQAFAKPTAAEKQAEADAAKAKMEQLEEALDEASDAYYAALEEQEEAEAAAEEAQAKVDEAQAAIDEETAHIQELQEKLGNRARSMYRAGNTSFLDVLLGSASFEEFANNMAMLDTINQKDADMVIETKEARERLEAAKKEYEEQAAIAQEEAEKAQAAAAEAKAVKDEAAAKEAEMEELYDQLSEEAADLLAEEEAERERQAREAAAAANGSSSSGSTDNSKVQTVTGNTVVDRAYAQLGKPYVWGAAGPNSFDCSGLVGYCLTGKMGNHWTHTGIIQTWTRVSDPVPGDICINSHHTGVYIGGGQMIHAPHTGDVVKISPVKSNMWYVRY